MVANYTGLMAVKLARPMAHGDAEQRPDSPWTFQESAARADPEGDVDKLASHSPRSLARTSLGKVNSLHGAKAARRHATNELLFFASAGDVERCQKVCSAWKIDVSPPARQLQLRCCVAWG